MRSDVMTL